MTPRQAWLSALDLALGAWWVLRYTVAGRDPGELSEGADSPVLVLQGVYEPWQFMLPVARLLHAAGHPVYRVPGLRNNRLAVADAAALAQQYLDELGLVGVTIVAHSKGGLIAKFMMTATDSAHRIDRVIAISTPFSGSTLARYSPARTLRAFMPTDVTLHTLAINLEANARITSIYSEFDPVIPVRSHLEGAVNVEIPIVGHFGILRDPAALDAVESAMATGVE